jgi:hypothetical protein
MHEKSCELRIPGVEVNPGPPPPINEEGMEILRQVKEKYLICCDKCDICSFKPKGIRLHKETHGYTKRRYMYQYYIKPETFFCCCLFVCFFF